MKKKSMVNKKDGGKRNLPNAPQTLQKKTNGQCTVVALGGSAGGLEAFDLFFRHMPPDSGMAFVIVAHLDPTHKGMLPELLQRTTTMSVVEAEDGMKVLPNWVYIIPSNKDLSILRGKLQLFDPGKPRGVRMPIDFFFRSLAEDIGASAVGIILSGMGSDGTLGIRSIKERMGMVMVQDPKTIQYDSMPLSAISAGIVDYVLPVEKMPKKLLSYAKKDFSSMVRELPPQGEKTLSALQKIFLILRTNTGHDFSLYKLNTLYRRIERRMEVNGIEDITEYIRYIQETPQEVATLFKELLIGVTKFFRDPEAFEALKNNLVKLLDSKPEGGTVRAWVPACSTGEEAYSIAILLKECFEAIKEPNKYKAQIFASDIDQESVEKARAGIYPANISADISPDRLSRFFVAKDSAYKIKREIREMVVFAMQDLIKDPPFTRLDLVSCRNLLIYLTPELQKKIIPLFHYTLNSGGVLFLGSAENIGSFTDIFSLIDTKGRLFKSKDISSPYSPIGSFSFGPTARALNRMKEEEPMTTNKPGFSEITHRMLLNTYAPPSVIINANGDIVFSSGHIGKYLELSPGKPVVNIFEMAKEGLQPELSSAVYKATTKNKRIVQKNLKVRVNGGYGYISLVVQPVTEPGMHGLFMVIFENSSPLKDEKSHEIAPSPSNKKPTVSKEVVEELKYTREQLRKTHREMDTSLEESKSVNEELQSSNEELQSTNEELMTSKEELQSLNEELVTVNSEYQEKMHELSQANNDMKNLLDSTEIATIFLDNKLNIKRFTPQVKDIINLIPSDAGRPIVDIVLNLRYEHLVDDCREVLAKLLSREIQVETADNKWYIVRIMPYRTMENTIDGVVVTFSNVTKLKQLEQRTQALQKYSEDIVDTVREPLAVLDAQLRIISANRSFYTVFKIDTGQVKGQLLYTLNNNEWDIPQLRSALNEVIEKNTVVTDFMVEHDFREIGHKKMLLNARMVLNGNNDADMILLAIEDVTYRAK